MCKKCVDNVRMKLPKIAEMDISKVLMSATCFPFGDSDDVARDLDELSDKTDGTLNGCIDFAEKRLDEQMKDSEDSLSYCFGDDV